MRIAYVVSSYYPQVGGVEMHVRSIAEACGTMGDQVTVLTHRNGDQSAEELINDVRILRFPLISRSPNYAFSPMLFRYLRTHVDDFDLVHSHSYHTIVGQAAAVSGLPFIFTPHYHGTGHTSFRALLHRIYKPVGARQFRAADAVICVSAAERDLVAKDFPTAAEKVSVIPNGTVQRARLSDLPGDVPERTVLTVGRLERYKNLELVIRAFHAMSADANLMIVGEGPDRTRLEELSRDIRPNRPIHFTGRIPDDELDRLMARATVVTSASDHEAFGLILADGLAAGARAVASDIPAHRELGQLAGATAPITFVDPNNVQQYASALLSALEKGRVAPGTVRFASWADVAGETRKLYDHVIHEAGFMDHAFREEHV